MKKAHLVLVGRCPDCRADVPFLAKNKVPTQEAWRCLKCGAVNAAGQLSSKCYRSFKDVSAQFKLIA